MVEQNVVMFQIDDTVVSPDIIEECFLCNLDACKGECCVEGDAGAPLEEEEVEVIKELLPTIWDDLSTDAQEVIEKQGVAYKDDDGDMVTSLVNGKDCVFTYYDDNDICKCAIEKAYREGKTKFYKPISCHLYPIRVQKYTSFTAINYHRWHICECATLLGKKEKVRVYQFLKEPLIRSFGEEWYKQLDEVAEEYAKTLKENQQ